ncbi:S8 family peptidase [Candidatus Latescibacterota bacterium]
MIFVILALTPCQAWSEASISPSLLMLRNAPAPVAAKRAEQVLTGTAAVTIRFDVPPSPALIAELERHGLTFTRIDGELLHTTCIYPALAVLDSLEVIAAFPEIVRIEDSYRPSATAPLDVSNTLVQASQVWDLRHDGHPVDGSGIIIADVDTGIDIFHPAFFKPDGGEYDWIDVNENGVFDAGVDAVDLDGDETADSDETLSYIDAPLIDFSNYHIMDEVFHDDVFDAGIDWLYNDADGSDTREYGPESGFTEADASFGEQFFVFTDSNSDNLLTPGEKLTGLGTSKVVGIYDKTGPHLRSEQNLFSATADVTNHGTPVAGIAIGGVPGLRFTGMAPGAEFIAINRADLPSNPYSVEAGIIWAVSQGADLVMHEFGSWVGEFLDGTSNYEQMIVEHWEAGIPQFTASGNLAGPTRKKHALFTISTYEKKTLTFTVPTENEITAVHLSFLWRNTYGYTGPTITLKLSDGSSRSLVFNGEPYAIGNFYLQSGHDISSAGTARIDMVITAQPGTDTVSGDFTLDFTYGWSTPPQLDIDAYIYNDKTGWMNGAQFTTEAYLTDDGTVTMPGTALRGVTVGAYTPRGYRARSASEGSSELFPGDIGDFSGWGMTTDGRRAVDITASGFAVFSVVSHYATPQQPGGYYNFGGTSAALPFVAGCAALILQALPDLPPSQLPAEIERILYSHAGADQFTGTDIPNDTWGYGKLKIYDSFIGEHLVLPTAVAEQPLPFTVSPAFPNPFNVTTRVEVSLSAARSLPLKAWVYNLLGQKVRTLPLSPAGEPHYSLFWDGTDDNGLPVASGAYLIVISTPQGSRTTKTVFMK